MASEGPVAVCAGPSLRACEEIASRVGLYATPRVAPVSVCVAERSPRSM